MYLSLTLLILIIGICGVIDYARGYSDVIEKEKAAFIENLRDAGVIEDDY